MRSKSSTLFKEKNTKPKLSHKFDAISVYYNGIYYFPNDLRASNVKPDKPFSIQGVFYDGKWRQDTFYITHELKNIIFSVME